MRWSARCRPPTCTASKTPWRSFSICRTGIQALLVARSVCRRLRFRSIAANLPA
jgi:hypothetical protein